MDPRSVMTLVTIFIRLILIPYFLGQATIPLFAADLTVF